MPTALFIERKAICRTLTAVIQHSVCFASAASCPGSTNAKGTQFVNVRNEPHGNACA